MTPGIPRQRRNAVARFHAESDQGIGQLLHAHERIGVGGAVYGSFDAAGNDGGIAVEVGGESAAAAATRSGRSIIWPRIWPGQEPGRPDSAPDLGCAGHGLSPQIPANSSTPVPSRGMRALRGRMW